MHKIRQNERSTQLRSLKSGTSRSFTNFHRGHRRSTQLEKLVDEWDVPDFMCYDSSMIYMGFILVLLQFSQSAAVTDIPNPPGVYYQNSDKSWISIPKAAITKSKLTGTGLFVETGGYTNLGTDVVCDGARASMRVSGPRPVFYVRGIGPSSDALLIHLTKKKSTRTFYKSSANSSFENKIGAKKSDIRRTAVNVVSEETYSITPDVDLKPGEYLMVIGDPENSFDFGIDPTKK